MTELTMTEQMRIDSEMQKHIHRAFDAIYTGVEVDFHKPSEISQYLEKYWDLGDFYRDWWETDPEGEWQ